MNECTSIIDSETGPRNADRRREMCINYATLDWSRSNIFLEISSSCPLCDE